VLVGRKYWSGLIDWIKEEMLGVEHTISPEDMDLFTLVDTSDEAVDCIVRFYSRYLLSPNF
jgi:predicted Rossmann-fold nucleotide-binding protein